MARVGLNDIEKRTATRTVFQDMFKPTAETEEVKETEEKPVVKPQESKKKKVKTKQKTRQTYYMDPILIEALRQMSFETREGVSDLVNDLIRESMPDKYIEIGETVVGGAMEKEAEEE